MKRTIILILSGAVLLAAAWRKMRSDDRDWELVRKAVAQRHGVDLLTASEITVGRNPDGSLIRVKIVRNPKPKWIPLSPRGDFDTAHERQLREGGGGQPVGDIGLRPSTVIQENRNGSW